MFSLSVQAQLICGKNQDDCEGHSDRNPSAPAFPSNNSSIHLNPSAVPTDNVFGLETIYFKGFDFVIVKGLGRVGAAASPSNNEETFFGVPAFESGNDYLSRMQAGDKYQSQKVTLATGFSILDNRQSGLSRFHVEIGMMGKYDRLTSHVLPGAGVSAIFGPLTVGYAMSEDEFVTNSTTVPPNQVFGFSTETLSAGIYLSSFAIDYSLMKIYAPGAGDFTVTLVTGSLFLKRWIFTLAGRQEDSGRPIYDPSTGTIVQQQIKNAVFGGVQFAIMKHLMIDAFYDYYLLGDISLGATLFF